MRELLDEFDVIKRARIARQQIQIWGITNKTIYVPRCEDSNIGIILREFRLYISSSSTEGYVA